MPLTLASMLARYCRAFADADSPPSAAAAAAAHSFSFDFTMPLLPHAAVRHTCLPIDSIRRCR